MTKQHNAILKPWIAALSLGATLGGWAILARQDFTTADTPPAQPTATPETIVKAIHLDLPPVPTVEALLAYAAPGPGTTRPAVDLDLPPIPAVVAPAPQVIQAPASQPAAAPQPQAPPPVTTTRSSK